MKYIIIYKYFEESFPNRVFGKQIFNKISGLMAYLSLNKVYFALKKLQYYDRLMMVHRFLGNAIVFILVGNR